MFIQWNTLRQGVNSAPRAAQAIDSTMFLLDAPALIRAALQVERKRSLPVARSCPPHTHMHGAQERFS